MAENAVLSVAESRSKVFQERSNQVFQKLENILTIFKEEKVSTTHLSVVDRWGNVASMTSSIEFAFGSAIMVRGFLLNNQLQALLFFQPFLHYPF